MTMDMPHPRIAVHGPWPLPYWLVGALGLVALALSSAFSPGVDPYFETPFDPAAGINQAEAWLRDNFRAEARAISGVVRSLIHSVEDFLIARPWPIVVLAVVGPAFVFGGWRLGLGIGLCVLVWGVLRQWDMALQTLALMGVSVALALVIGFPLGILSGVSGATRLIITPVLDAMQTMPAFVYLVPAIFFFGVGAAAAVLATVIYAMPPIVRLTSHGLRATPPVMVEVAQCYGASPSQILMRIRLPVAMASVLVGVNQTIMMALGLVVLAALIGAPGLGSEIWLALQKLNVGKALEGGICIVAMAIMFDRILAAATRTNDARTALGSVHCARWWRNGTVKHRLHVLFGLAVALVLLDTALRQAGLAAGFPKGLELDIRAPVNGFVQSIITFPALVKTTEAATWAAYTFLLNPIQSALMALPFWAFGVAAALLTGRIGGWRLAALTIMALCFLGFSGLWMPSMQTLAAIVVAVGICALLGFPLAIWAGRSPRVDQALKPVLDTMQTLPAFVYLVPVIMFFGGNVVSALIATVIYALPPVVRIGAMGFRDIPKEVDDALTSFGTHPIHGIWRVRLPLAMPALVAGMNQAIMMALAMQVITPLIGGGGLGREVYHALGLSDSGHGLVAGVCIVMIAIVLDRCLTAWAERRQRALSGASK